LMRMKRIRTELYSLKKGSTSLILNPHQLR
jgi:hypothetical protein